MNAKKPVFVSSRVKHFTILIGLSLLAALSVHADQDEFNEPSTLGAESGTSIESANGTGTPNRRSAPSDLSSANGTGRNSVTQPAEEFAELSAVEDAQPIGCESAEGNASEICGSGESESGGTEE